MKRMLLALAVLGTVASPAAAAMCSALAGQVEEALAVAPGLDAATRAAITSRMEEGMTLHEAGDHAGSEAALMAALRMLVVNGR